MFPATYAPHQRGSASEGQYSTPHYGTLTPHRGSSLSGHHHRDTPYSIPPRSPTRPVEAPLTDDEVFFYTSAWPYKCSCREVFRGRSQIGAHVQQNVGHYEVNPGKNLRACLRGCARMIDDFEDLVDHLERRHNIPQDVREIFTPFFDRSPAYVSATPVYTGSGTDYTSVGMQHTGSIPQPFHLQPVSQPPNTVLNRESCFFPAAQAASSPHTPLCVSQSTSNPTTILAKEMGQGHGLVREVKPYTCMCGRAYNRQSDLQTHVGTPTRNHHDTTEYKFHCQYCTERHPTGEWMQKHMEMAHGMKHTMAEVNQIAFAITARSLLPQIANQATKSSTKSFTTAHHTPDQVTEPLRPLPPKVAEYYRNLEPFKCKCANSYITHTSLMTHVKYYQNKGLGQMHADASGEDRYLHPCVICHQFKFTTPKQLKFHLNEHHKMEYVK